MPFQRTGKIQTDQIAVEKGNIEVREVRSTRLNEQNGQIEVFSIEPDGE